jgi:ABC-2 type transport system ATP-binding protein
VIVFTEDLSHTYGTRTALAGLTFGVERGEIFGVLGPNGGGKSTLFRILCTLMQPSDGRARIADFDVVTQPAQVRRRIGVVFQSQSLDKKLTPRENLHHQGHLYGIHGPELRKRVDDALSRLGLSDRRDDLVRSLSGGLQRRVEIAKALLHAPEVILMDEPSTGLDPGARRELWQYLEELQRGGTTILLTTHILDEADRCSRLLLLHEGRKVAEGTPAELKSRVGGDVVVLEAEGIEQELEERFGVQAKRIDGRLHIEIPDGHRFVPAVMEAFPGRIQSIALHKPTLEDVFVSLTGVTLDR